MKIGKVSALAIMMMGLAGCVKEISPLEEPQAEGVEFSIFASTQSETKTEYSDDGHITWSAVDTMNVFHKGKGSYVNNYPFTVSDAATGKFDGKLKEALDASTSYKWFAVYPYDSETTSPEAATVRIGAAAGEAQAQTGDDSRLHLVGTGHPLYGTATTTGVQAPELTMHQAASIIGIKVKNETGTPLKVGEVTFTAPEAIVGDFTMDITGRELAFTSTSAVSQTARLTVTGASTLTQDAEATYFLTIKPFTATSGAILKLSVNGYEKTITLTKDVIFHPGKIKTIGFGYNAEPATGYQLVTEEPSDWSGKYVIVSADKKYLWTGANTTSNTVTLSASDFDGNVIVKSGLSGYEFTISKSGSGYYLMKDGKYVYCNYSGDGNGTTGIGLSSSSHAISFNGSMNSGTVGFYMHYGDKDQYIYLKTSGGSSYFKFGGSHDGNGVYLYSIPVVKEDRGLAFANAEVSKTFGDAAFTNTLTGETEGVSFSSSEPSVATVDPVSGQVTIVGAGSATITATAEATNTLKAGSAEFTLTVAKAAQTISFSKTSVDYNMAAGSFTAPALSGAKTAVTYTSSDANVAAVNSSTGTVTIKGVGSVTITATAAETANYTSASASYTINVTDSTPTVSVSGYHLVTSEPGDWSGKYVIVSANKKYLWTGANTTSNTVTLSASDFDGNVIVKSGLSGYEFTISKNDSGYYLMKDGKYVYCNYSGDGNRTTGIGLSSSSHAISFNGSMNSGTVGFYMHYGEMDQYIYLKTSDGSSYFKFGGSHGGDGVYLYKYVEGNGSGTVTPSTDKTFKKVSSFTSGKKYVIVDGTNALKNNNGTDEAYSVAGKVSGNTLTVAADAAEAITWTAGTNSNYTAQGSITLKNGSYYLARGNTSVNNDVVLVTTVNGYAVWSFDGQNLKHKNSSGAYTFHVFYDGSRWNAEQQSATNNITIYEEN